MRFRPINEFNAFGVVSPEMLLRLQTLAQRDSHAIVSVFTAVADAAGLTERGRLARLRNAEHLAALARTAMAGQERLAEMQRRLDRLEEASYEALLEADEKRRTARRELEQLRERAYQLTMPDGRTVRVYRDGDVMRQDDGSVVGREIIRAEDVPDSFPTWQQMQASVEADRNAERRYREVTEYRERLARHRDEIAQGGVTSERADELDADIAAMPDSVRVRLGEAPPREQVAQLTPQGQGASTPGPR